VIFVLEQFWLPSYVPTILFACSPNWKVKGSDSVIDLQQENKKLFNQPKDRYEHRIT